MTRIPVLRMPGADIHMSQVESSQTDAEWASNRGKAAGIVQGSGSLDAGSPAKSGSPNAKLLSGIHVVAKIP